MNIESIFITIGLAMVIAAIIVGIMAAFWLAKRGFQTINNQDAIDREVKRILQ